MIRGKGVNRMTVILLTGLVITFFCLAICISLINVLDTSYTKEVADDFHAHHESLTKTLENRVAQSVDIARGASEALDTTRHNFDTSRINEIIYDYGNSFGVTEINFMDIEGNVICSHSQCFYKDNTDILKTYMDKFTKVKDDSFCAIMIGENAEDGAFSARLLCQVPVYYGISFKGYMIVSRDVTDLFESEEFDYLNEMGEAYLIDGRGNVLARSSESRITTGLGANLFVALGNYSNEKSETLSRIENMKENLNADATSYISIDTKDGYKLQISYSKLSGVSNICFVTCFDDNLIGKKVQPLIFRSVFSCMAIMVLMLGVVIYVWSTAKKDNLTIEKLAFEDSVTDGHNVNYFIDFVPKVQAIYNETPFMIRRFDIVNFRYINEAYGHNRADGVLKACIDCFEEIFSSKELCVRMNSDQFIAIMVNEEDVEKKLTQYEKRVNEEARGQGVKYPIKFKAGVYQIRKSDSDVDVMIDRANVARKTDKGDDSKLGVLYSDKVVTDMRKVNRIEADMQRALATGEFKVYIQSKWDIKADVVCGGEALVRWIKPDGTTIYPDEFISIFENNGFVEKLDFYMLEMVCEKIRELIDNGDNVLPISVNQSRILLHSPDYVKNVEKIINRYNIPPGYIELEITESVFQDDLSSMIKTVNELKKLGIRLSMDDFGSGYSSLNMLKDVPFDIIKIDRVFFSESVASEVSRWILQETVEMVNGLGMETICEGVETIEQVKFLQQIGCKCVQGFLYSMPVPFESFIDRNCRRYV